MYIDSRHRVCERNHIDVHIFRQARIHIDNRNKKKIQRTQTALPAVFLDRCMKGCSLVMVVASPSLTRTLTVAIFFKASRTAVAAGLSASGKLSGVQVLLAHRSNRAFDAYRETENKNSQ